jgi:hypothetical protein
MPDEMLSENRRPIGIILIAVVVPTNNSVLTENVALTYLCGQFFRAITSTVADL